MHLARVSSTLPGTNLLPTAPLPDDLRAQPVALTDNARTVLRKRYLRRGEDGKAAETEQEMFWRVAYHIALAEEEFDGNVTEQARAYYELLTKLEFFPNSPTFTGAGTPLGQLAACFTEAMRVTTSMGLKRIADLAIGDLVLTHKGHYRPVTEVFERSYAGKLLKIRTKQIGGTLEVTPEHPILTPNGWVKAGELQVGDLVAIGVPQGTELPVAFDLAALSYGVELELQETVDAVRVRKPSTYQNSGVQARWGNRFLETSSDLARLCGYFISEGTVGPDNGYIRFTFSKDETDYHEDVIHLVKSVFGIECSVSPSNYGNWTAINVYSRAVTIWFKENFGSHSFGKRLPLWIQFAPADFQEQFLIGILRGDGLFYERDHVCAGNRQQTFRALRLTLSNPSLIQQIWQMSLRLGYDASMRAVDTTYVTPTARETAQINIPPMQGQELASAAFGKHFSPADARYIRNPVQRKDGQVFFPIKSIESETFSGTVYNCEVEEDHSYVTEGVIVHNCFVLAIEDDMGRSESGIFQTLRNAALIQQTGGGNGFSFSRLRPKGSLVHSSNGEATGPVGFLRVYDQAFGEIAQGGCLLPDTLVFTDRGLLRLDEIVTNSVRGWESHDLVVATDEGQRRSTQRYNNGLAPVLKVTTDEGLQITGTPNHKVKVMTDRGPEWRRLDELKAGDAMLVKLGQHQGQLQQLVQPMKQYGDVKTLRLPTELNEKLAYFLGCIAKNGIISSDENDNRISINVSDLTAEIVIRQLFGEDIDIYRQNDADDTSATYTIDNRLIKHFLLSNELIITEELSRIPRRVRQSPPDIVMFFLQGLLGPDFELTLTYESLNVLMPEVMVHEVATLLIGIGHPVKISEVSFQETTAWNLSFVTDAKLAVNESAPRIGTPRGTTPISVEPTRSDLWLVTVASIKDRGKLLTLDIEVEGNHTYLANGLVTHNSRRGANMAVLKVSHPDIREFITCKSSESQITNFNISVGMTDDFMRAVEADGMFNLVAPNGGKVYETIRARDLFDMIVKQAHFNGEPGVLFLDAANRQNPVPHLYELESTNPCGEQYLGPFENCCLGSLNLARLSVIDGHLDWDELREWTETATRFLDDVVSANSYVPGVPQLAEAAHRVRRIGLGIMGLADLMYKLGVRYGSEEGQEFAGQVLEFVRWHCMKSSIELAKERGAFPAIHGSIYDPEDIKWTPPQPLFPYTRDWGRPELDWSKILKGIKKHGIRNGAQLTVAPTGTIATVSGCEGYGCEPVFALAYIRHVNDKGQDLQLQYTSPQFEKALHDAGLNEEQIARIIEKVNQEGTCQNVADLPAHIRHTFVVSADVTAEEHIRMQGAMQAFVDNAISKTCNFPSTATAEDVAKAYMLGWKLGCKGLTVYVTGSREKVVLETHATAQAKQAEPQAPAQAVAIAEESTESDQMVTLPLFQEPKKPRPHRLEGRTYRIGTPLGATFITVNENGEGKGQPFELFIHTAKAGSETAAISEAIGRLASLILRIASPVKPRERLKELVNQLDGIGGGRSTGFGSARVRSLPDGVAQVLTEYLEETANEPTALEPASSIAATQTPLPLGKGSGIVGDLCPECGEASVVNEEGCRKCYSCGYSEC